MSFFKLFLGYHTEDGGKVYKYSNNSTGMSFTKCELCSRSSAFGTLPVYQISDITSVTIGLGDTDIQNTNDEFLAAFQQIAHDYNVYLGPKYGYVNEGRPFETVNQLVYLLEAFQYLDITNVEKALADTTGWNDLRVAASAVRVPTSAAPSTASFRTVLRELSFDNVGGEYVYFDAQLSHNYRPGTPLSWHVHFAPVSNILNGQTVIFELQYSHSSVWGGFSDVTVIDATFINTADARARIAEKDPSYVSGTTILANACCVTDIEGIIPWDIKPNLGFSSLFACRLERLAGTYTGDAILISTDFHYYGSGVGTSAEFSNNN